VAEGLVTEEILVYALGDSEMKRRENQENVRRLKIALAEEGEELRAASARAERAKIIVEALEESARIHGEGEKPSKRGRYE
jgi:adenylosuccinate lyase